MAGPPGGAAAPETTRFLALDKCLPDKHFLQLVRVSRPADEVAAERAEEASSSGEAAAGSGPSRRVW